MNILIGNAVTTIQRIFPIILVLPLDSVVEVTGNQADPRFTDIIDPQFDAKRLYTFDKCYRRLLRGRRTGYTKLRAH